MTDWRADRIAAAFAGENPTVLCELGSAFAVIGDVQFLPGYSLALSKVPGADRLSSLPRPDRVSYLADVDLVATAVENVCSRLDPAFRRVNIEILGNADAFVHAHIWPRYDWEPAENVRMPVWLYPPERWHEASTALKSAHDSLRVALSSEIARLDERYGRNPPVNGSQNTIWQS